jgi:signal transduction histidine kinase
VGGLTVVLMVEDTGIGIPVESRQRLFQPFSQIDSTIQRKYGGQWMIAEELFCRTWTDGEYV